MLQMLCSEASARARGAERVQPAKLMEACGGGAPMQWQPCLGTDTPQMMTHTKCLPEQHPRGDRLAPPPPEQRATGAPLPREWLHPSKKPLTTAAPLCGSPSLRQPLSAAAPHRDSPPPRPHPSTHINKPHGRTHHDEPLACLVECDRPVGLLQCVSQPLHQPAICVGAAAGARARGHMHLGAHLVGPRLLGAVGGCVCGCAVRPAVLDSAGPPLMQA